jgi:hypothetical protein
LFLTSVRPVDVFIPFRWVREGLFRFTFELHRSSRSSAARSSDTYVLFISVKKKELFNVKEAHNHSFCHTVCGFAYFLRPWLTGAQTANWGWYYNLDQSCDN